MVRLGEGNDTYNDTKTREKGVADTVYGGPGADRILGKFGHDRYFGENGADTIIGGIGNETIRGGAQNDLLKGRAGKDLLFGNGGDDKLFGGAMNDVLRGSFGKDRLEGNWGNDILYGGSGRDIFVFRRKDGKDVIKDFNLLQDRIHIDIKGMTFAKLKLSQSKDGAKINYGSGEILLEDISVRKLGADDFAFG